MQKFSGTSKHLPAITNQLQSSSKGAEGEILQTFKAFTKPTTNSFCKMTLPHLMTLTSRDQVPGDLFDAVN